MIKIIVKNVAEITGLEIKVKNRLKTKFTLVNPIFNQKINTGLSVFGIPSSLKYYEEKNNKFIVPIGGLNEVLLFLSNNNYTYNLIDNRSTFSDANYFNKFTFNGTLRDYQNRMIKELENKTIGVIDAMTGSGKTVTFIKKIFDLKLNTLIIVNTTELVTQTRDSLIEFSNLTKENIGLVGGGKFLIKPITISLHQTLMHVIKDKKKLSLLNSSFGAVIADEVHICAANRFFKNLTSLDMKYKFGFSATPKDRADGLSKAIFFATGPLLYKVPIDDLIGSLIIPSLKIVETDYYFPLFDSSDYTYMMSDLAVNEERNKLIVNTVLKDFSSENDYVVILCNQVTQVKTLNTLLGENAECLTSSTPKKERIKIMSDLKVKKIKYIVSTYSLFSTGINVKHLNVVVLAAPRKSKIALKQTAGRVMRRAPGKTKSIIVDFVDIKIGILRGQSKVRHNILRNLKI